VDEASRGNTQGGQYPGFSAAGHAASDNVHRIRPGGQIQQDSRNDKSAVIDNSVQALSHLFSEWHHIVLILNHIAEIKNMHYIFYMQYPPDQPA
jgi:hypothetical protein